MEKISPPLIEAFRENKVLLVIGPTFSAANGYFPYLTFFDRIIKNDLFKESIHDSNLPMWLKKGNYLKIGEWIGRRLEEKEGPLALEKIVSEHFAQDRYPNILYRLIPQIPAQAIITANLDHVLETQLLRNRNKTKVHSVAFLEHYKKDTLFSFWKDFHLCFILGKSKHPETILLRYPKFTKALADENISGYLRKGFQKYIPLFLGFLPNDPLLKILIELWGNECGEHKQGFVFFPVDPGEPKNRFAKLNLFFPEEGFVPKDHLLKQQNSIETFLTKLIEQITGQGRHHNLPADRPEAKAFKLLEKGIIEESRKKTVPEQFYSGRVPCWGTVAEDLDAPRDITPDIKEFLRVQKLSVCILSAPSGYGKSTVCYRVAYDLFTKEEFKVIWLDDPSNIPSKLIKVIREHKEEDVLLVVDRAQDLSDIHIRLSHWKKKGFTRLRILLCGRTHEIAKGVVKLPELKKLARYEEFEMTWISPTEAEYFVEKLTQHSQLGKLSEIPAGERAAEFKNKAKGDLLAALLTCTKGQDLDKIIADVCERVRSMPEGDFLLKGYALVASLNRLKVDFSWRLFLTVMDMEPDDIFDKLLYRLPGELGLALNRNTMEVRHQVISEAVCRYLFGSTPPIFDEIAIYEEIFEGIKLLNQDYELKLASIIPNKMILSEPQKASVLFEKATIQIPEHLPALHAWAMLEKDLEHYSKSRELLSKAISINPDNIHSYQAWAILEKEQKDYKKARKLFKKAVEINPKNAPSFHAWAIMEKEQNNIDDARGLFFQAVESDSNHERSWASWAEMEREIDDPKGLELLQKKAKELNYDLKSIGHVPPKQNESVKSSREEKAAPDESSWPYTPRWITENLSFDDIRNISYLLAGLATRLEMSVMLVEIKKGRPELVPPINRTAHYPDFCKNLFGDEELRAWDEHPCRIDMRQRIRAIYKQYETKKNLDNPVIRLCHCGSMSLYHPILLNGRIIGIFIIGKLPTPLKNSAIDKSNVKNQQFTLEVLNEKFPDNEYIEKAEKNIDMRSTNNTWTESALKYAYEMHLKRGIARVVDMILLMHKNIRHQKVSRFLAELNQHLSLPIRSGANYEKTMEAVGKVLSHLKEYLSAEYVGLFLGQEPRDRYLQLVAMSSQSTGASDPPSIYLDRKIAKIPDEVMTESGWNYTRYQQDVKKGAISGKGSPSFGNIQTLVPFSRMGHVGALAIGPLQRKGTEEQINSLNRLCFDLGLQLINLYLADDYRRKRDFDLLGYSLFLHSLKSAAHRDISALNFIERFICNEEDQKDMVLDGIAKLRKSQNFFSEQVKESLKMGTGAYLILTSEWGKKQDGASALPSTPAQMEPMVKNLVDRYERQMKDKEMSFKLSENRLAGLLVTEKSYFIEKMIFTLLGNAIYHGLGNTEIEVNWLPDEGSMIRFTVSGVSNRIEPGQQQIIWDLQETGPDAKLHGLYMVKNLAENFGGKAGRISSEIDPPNPDYQRHTFWFTYPYLKEEMP